MAIDNTLPLANIGPGNLPVADDPPDLVVGYPMIAERMGLVPEMGIFRRFAALSDQVLFYMQEELLCLEKEFRKIELQDSKNTEGTSHLYCRDYRLLRSSGSFGDKRQLDALMELKKKIMEYGKFLKLQASLASMSPPSAYDLKRIRQYAHSEDKAGKSMAPTDETINIWGKEDDPSVNPAPDLVVLRAREEMDPFSNLVINNGLEMFRKHTGDRWAKRFPDIGVKGYDDPTLLRITSWVNSVLASMLPFLAIVVLYFVKPMGPRLGIIAGFNIIFALYILCFTQAKRSEVFAAVAAFSAVQVVFISGSNGQRGYT